MADTAVAVTNLTTNAAVANPAGTAIVAANTHVITPTKPFGKVAVRLTNTFAGAKDFTILAGDYPPAESAGQGDLVVNLADGSSTATVTWVVLESARFVQDNGTIRINVAASTTGNIAALQLP